MIESDPSSKARQFLQEARIAGKTNQASYDHCLRVCDLVSTAGGTSADKAVSLLHEARDAVEALDEALGERIAGLVDTAFRVMPDYLRHAPDELRRREHDLKTVPMSLRLIWLCDLIDTFEAQLIRLDSSEGDIDIEVQRRCREAYHMTDICLDNPRFTHLVTQARDAIVKISMIAGAGMISNPPKP